MKVNYPTGWDLAYGTLTLLITLAMITAQYHLLLKHGVRP